MPISRDLSVHAQLFLDDDAIEDTFFVSRQWHRPRVFPDPVLVAEHPWERWAPVAYGSVLEWRGKLRMWYVAWTRSPKPRVCYAESADGVAWEKPKLGVCEFEGSRDNNIVLEGTAPDRYIDNLTVIDDPTDEEWPLKTLYWEGAGHPPDREDWGIWLARSRDGVRWDRSPGLVLPGWVDRFNAVSERVGGKVIVLGRGRLGHRIIRRVVRAESADFRTWTEPVQVLSRDTEDPPYTEYYSAMAFPYEGLLIGGLERMAVSPDTLDTELIWSDDAAKTWRRARTRPAFLAPEPQRHWGRAWTNLTANAPIRRSNRLWFYFTGRNASHGVTYPFNHSAIGLAELRIDGFASLHATEREGEVLTKAAAWPGGDLHINADPRRDLLSHPGFSHGHVLVEVRGEDNKPLDGFAFADCEPFWRNTSEAPDASAAVTWRTGKTMRDHAGKRVRFAFRLRDAHLFSFRAKV